MGWLCRLNRLVGAVIFGAQWLALPLILLLFLQWEIRSGMRSSVLSSGHQLALPKYPCVTIGRPH